MTPEQITSRVREMSKKNGKSERKNFFWLMEEIAMKNGKPTESSATSTETDVLCPLCGTHEVIPEYFDDEQMMYCNVHDRLFSEEEVAEITVLDMMQVIE